MHLDPELLARLQFAFTITFHIIFPSFTIGTAAFIATLLVRWMVTGQDHLLRLARFWTKIFAVSFAMGVVSGLVLSYQLGTNWSRFSMVVGNVIGPMIGYEVLTAFFLEATFLGVMLFGWKRVPPWLHTMSAIFVATGTAISAFWILSANSWMQTPAGFEMRDGIALAGRLADRDLQSELLLSPAAHADRGLPDHVAGRALGRRALRRRRSPLGRSAHHAAHGHRHAGDPRSAADRDRRSARAQHAQISADQDRRDRGALGWLAARRAGAVRLARRQDREQPLSGRHSARGLADPHPHL